MSKPTEADIIAEVERLRTLGKDDLRLRWSTLFGKAPPPALTKDLLGHMIAWRIQEKFYGGRRGFNCFALAMSASPPAVSPLARFASPRLWKAKAKFGLSQMAWS
jgi:hypothetical protein